MRILKTYLYEVISALALLGIAQFYFLDEQLFTITKILTIAMYVMIVVVTEALIVSRLQPSLWRIITVNLLIALIISMAGLDGVASLATFGIVAGATLILRLGVAAIAAKTPKAIVNRHVAALSGSILLIEIVATAYGTVERIYYDDFFYPKVKPGYILPTTRWQYCAEQAVFWIFAIGLLYMSYRLLKYAFRSNTGVTT